MQGGNCGSQVPYFAIGSGVLENRAEDIVLCQLGEIRNDQFKTETLSAGFQDVDGLRETSIVDEKGIGITAAHTLCQRHRFCRGGCFVQQGGIGQIHAAEIQNHLLECQETFQAPLRHFGLIGGVGGVPARVFQHLAQNHVRRKRVVVTEANERAGSLILAHHCLQPRKYCCFCSGFAKCQRSLECDGIGYRLFDQLCQRAKLQFGQHRVDVFFIRTDVSADEFVGVLQARERARRWCVCQHVSLGQ